MVWFEMQYNAAWRAAGCPWDFSHVVSRRLWNHVFDASHDPLDNSASWRAVEGLVTV